MSLVRPQRTIAASAVVEGVGYWSGQHVRVEFRPAAVDTGICFVRQDISPKARVAATVLARVEKSRRTNLVAGGVGVEMVEHVLAALAGLQIDNCEVWVDAAEMPGCDGSSRAFVTALDAAGITEQSSTLRPLVVDVPLRLEVDDRSIEVGPPRGENLTVEFELDYGSDNAIGRQTIAREITPDIFRQELSDSRTFLLEQEAQWLISQGLGTHVSPRELLIFGPDGPVDNELRYPNECVRHKVLDMVGDFALAGRPIVGHVVAKRTGHQLNADLVKALLEREQQSQSTSYQAQCA